MSELPPADSVLMGDAARVHIRAPAGAALRSRRLLRLAGDNRLVEQIRRGSEAAFEVAFERHAPPIVAFCRHMLGSPEEAEDAVQHTFAAAYRDLRRGGEREIALRPWLFTIARNRCLSVLRARRDLPSEAPETATAGLAEHVERRAELRQLLADVRELPDDQRAALLLAELGGLTQGDIAAVLGCEVQRVKALVYRARSGLVARREARELPCEQIREQLANLRGGSLRRTELRLHLRDCEGCRDFREQVKRQRQMLSVALPVAPTLGLKSSVLAAVGIGGGAAGGGAAVAGGAGAAGGGAAVAAGAGATSGFAGLAKVAAVAVVATGGVAGGTAVVVHDSASSGPPGSGASGSAEAAASPAAEGVGAATGGSAGTGTAAGTGGAALTGGAAGSAEGPRKRSGPGVGRLMGGDGARKRPTQAGGTPPGLAQPKPGRGNADKAHGRQGAGNGPVEAPPKDTPVRRGPAEPKAKPERAKPAPEAGAPTKQDRPSAPDKSGAAKPGAAQSGAAKPGAAKPGTATPEPNVKPKD